MRHLDPQKETSKLYVLASKRLKTRRGVKQLTRVRRRGSYLLGLFGSSQRWVCDGFPASGPSLPVCNNAKHLQTPHYGQAFALWF
jgi:hypothetical protein